MSPQARPCLQASPTYRWSSLVTGGAHTGARGAEAWRVRGPTLPADLLLENRRVARRISARAAVSRWVAGVSPRYGVWSGNRRNRGEEEPGRRSRGGERRRQAPCRPRRRSQRRVGRGRRKQAARGHRPRAQRRLSIARTGSSDGGPAICHGGRANRRALGSPWTGGISERRSNRSFRTGATCPGMPHRVKRRSSRRRAPGGCFLLTGALERQ